MNLWQVLQPIFRAQTINFTLETKITILHQQNSILWLKRLNFKQWSLMTTAPSIITMNNKFALLILVDLNAKNAMIQFTVCPVIPILLISTEILTIVLQVQDVQKDSLQMSYKRLVLTLAILNTILFVINAEKIFIVGREKLQKMAKHV